MIQIDDILNVVEVKNAIAGDAQAILSRCVDYDIQIEAVRSLAKKGGSSYHAAAAALVIEAYIKAGAKDGEEFPDYTVHDIDTVERFVSKSGNDTWKAWDEDGVLIFLRQAQKDMLQTAGLWDQLNAMPVGAIWDAEIIIHTTQDGDFRKPVQIDPGGKLIRPAEKSSSDNHPLDCVCPECSKVVAAAVVNASADDVPEPPENETAAIEWADRLIESGDFVVLDTETSDLDGYPIEVAVVSPQGTVLFERRIKLPKGEGISPKAFAVHGISTDMLMDCPEWGAVASEFADTIKGKTVVTYNAEFDLKILRRANAQYGIPLTLTAECAMRRYAEYNGDWDDYHGNWRWVTLGIAAAECKVDVSKLHTAAGDALATLGVIQALAAKAHTDKPMPDKLPY